MRIAVWIVVIGVIGLGCASHATPADTVHRHGKIHTVNAQDSVQQALAVRGGQIAARTAD